jgi:predicted RNase H-like HicB family nuclease
VQATIFIQTEKIPSLSLDIRKLKSNWQKLLSKEEGLNSSTLPFEFYYLWRLVMKNSYPIVLTPDNDGYTVYIPDFDINTQGFNLTEAIEMARDAIGLMGIDYEDDNKVLPTPSKINEVKHNKNDIVSLVDVDFVDYRKKYENRTVKKNCTIPSWLCYEAEKANINFSQVLQKAIKQELHIV